MSEPDPTTLGSTITIVRWWQAWDTEHDEFVTFRWEHDGWTIEGRLAPADVDYVMRLGPDGEVRQFMLFRDLDEPDLWLAHDGRGTWGEVNGAARPDLDGCMAVGPTNAMLLLSLPIRRLGAWAAEDETFTTKLGLIDVETLGVVAQDHAYTRTGTTSWSMIRSATTGPPLDAVADVDDDFLLIEVPGLGRQRSE